MARGTGRRALHIAQVMRMAREHGRVQPDGTRRGRPEDGPWAARPKPPLARRAARAGAFALVGTLAAGGLVAVGRAVLNRA
jgi:hypothetical protein